MIQLGELKPILAVLVLPPAAPLLLALLGLLLAAKRKAAGLALAFFAVTLLWLLSCQAVAVWLAQNILPQYAPLALSSLKSSGAQAIVVLGGGVQPRAPEYGEAQASPPGLARLRYGIWLSRQTGLPVAYAGGIGWGASGPQTLSEGAVARRLAQQDYGLSLRWVEDQSRDTVENAELLKPLLAKDRITRIALVTHAWHMPRSVQAFERAGFSVTAAPTAYILQSQNPLLRWLPSSDGLNSTQTVLREWLALQVAAR
jgi:uncharacterized SAM-binding protein YcdF (DUF218 family)